jgi:general secretion pathway protein K
VVNIAIADLGGRLSVNALVGSDGGNVDAVQKRRFYRLFAALGRPDGEELTGALIDWIDRDSVPYVDPESGASLGGEEDFYRQQQPPRGCKNAPFDTLEELALVRGFTPEVLRLAAPHLSVHGGTAVNVNTATAEVLMSLSDDPVIDRTAAEAIIESRREKPFRSSDDLQRLNRIPGLENLLRTSLAVASTTYRIDAWAWVNDGGRRVEAIVEKPGDQLLFLKVN